MAHRIALAGNSPTWRRGMSAVLADAGYEVTEVDPMDRFTPGVDGSAMVVGQNRSEISRPVIGIIEDNPYVPVILVVPGVDLYHLAEGLRAGAAGVVDEDSEGDILVATVAAALSGLIGVSKPIGRALAHLVPERADVPALSESEIEWLRAMASGSTVAEFAEEWGYSERAMFRNLKSLYVRIGVNNRTEALLWASRQSLLSV